MMITCLALFSGKEGWSLEACNGKRLRNLTSAVFKGEKVRQFELGSLFNLNLYKRRLPSLKLKSPYIAFPLLLKSKSPICSKAIHPLVKPTFNFM